MANLLSVVNTAIGAGALNKRVQLQSRTDTPDGLGSSTTVWTTVANTWAHMEAWKGRKDTAASQIYSSEYVRVLLRYRADININTKMRMLYGKRTYEITYVQVPAEAQTTIEMLVTEQCAYGSNH